jgi:ribosomal protein L11 methyltransferase
MQTETTGEKKQEEWLQVSVSAEPALAETVAAFLGQLAGGSEQKTAPDSGEGRETIVAYLRVTPETDQEMAKIEAFLDQLATLPGNSRPTVERRTIQDQDWNQVWKERFKPFSITPHLVIKPSWESCAPGPGQKIIEMDPGMAFGTGHHASTRLALLFCEEIFYGEGLRPDTVLDVGTGTGILAMAAALFGAARVLAVDNDPAAVAVAGENVLANGLQGTVTVSGVDLAQIPGAFDLVFANIIRDTLLEIASPLHARLKPGGRLILAGILAGDQCAEIRAAYETLGLQHLATATEGEWSALLFRRP